MGAVKIRDAGNARRTVIALKMRDSGNTLRTVSEIKMRDASNVLRTVWSAMEVSASPSEVSKTTASKSGTPANLTSPPVSVSIDGGVSPFTYAWSTLSGDAIADSPTASTTTFTANLLPGDESVTEAQVTVTDDAGATATATCTITLHYVDLS